MKFFLLSPQLSWPGYDFVRHCDYGILSWNVRIVTVPKFNFFQRTSTTYVFVWAYLHRFYLLYLLTLKLFCQLRNLLKFFSHFSCCCPSITISIRNIIHHSLCTASFFSWNPILYLIPRWKRYLSSCGQEKYNISFKMTEVRAPWTILDTALSGILCTLFLDTRLKLQLQSQLK